MGYLLRSLRSGIFIIFVASLLLAGCTPNQTLEISSTPTESKSKPIYFPDATYQPPATKNPTLNPTQTKIPTQTETPPLIADLLGYRIITSGNVEKLDLIVTGYIDQTDENLTFTAFDWSRDGALILTCTYKSPGSSFQVFDVISGLLISEVEVSKNVCKSPYYGGSWLKFSRDGSTYLGITKSPIIGNSGDSDIAVFDSRSGRRLSTLDGLTYPPDEYHFLNLAAFSSRGTRLALFVEQEARPASTQDALVQGGKWQVPYSSIELYDVATGEHWGTFLKHPNWWIGGIDYATEGEYLVILTGFSAQAWHVEGAMSQEVECAGPGISFSPLVDSAVLRCWYDKRNDKEGVFHMYWDLESGDSFSLDEIPGEYHLLKFSPDGQLLIGYTDGGEVSIWKAENGEYLFTLPDTYPTAVDVNFTGNGRLIAVLLEDGQLKLYGVQ